MLLFFGKNLLMLLKKKASKPRKKVMYNYTYTLSNRLKNAK
jgi:hypothetical protein